MTARTFQPGTIKRRHESARLVRANALKESRHDGCIKTHGLHVRERNARLAPFAHERLGQQRSQPGIQVKVQQATNGSVASRPSRLRWDYKCPGPLAAPHMRVYLAGPVRGTPAPEGSMETIRSALTDAGHDIVNVLATPGVQALVHAQDTRTFVMETDRMLVADLLVAEVSAPSHGVGWVTAWFLAKGRLAILCCHASRRADLSMLLGGNPSPWQQLIVYETADELREKLGKLLKR